jgi:glutamine cyclotransferase
MRFFGFSIAAFLAGAFGAQAQTGCPAPKPMAFEVQSKITRSITGFTEGLEVHGSDIYESTGPLGGSTRLMRIAPDGHVTVIRDEGRRFFGEGLTFLGDRIYQLSWQDRQVFVYDPNFKLVSSMPNRQEGWGLTNDGHELIFSDGSAHLFFADPATFKVTRSVTVRRPSRAVDQINELEYVDGQVYANVWMTKSIVRINPQTGCIDAEADMSPLWNQMSPGEKDQINADGDAVLNGIAYDPAKKLFYVTGKNWPMIFAGHFTGG